MGRRPVREASLKVCVGRNGSFVTLTGTLPGDRDAESGLAPRGHPSSRGHSHGHAHSHSHGSHLHPSAGSENTTRRHRATDFDMDKVRSTLKQLVRDWSEEVRLMHQHAIPLRFDLLFEKNAGKGRKRGKLPAHSGCFTWTFLGHPHGRKVRCVSQLPN